MKTVLAILLSASTASAAFRAALPAPVVPTPLVAAPLFAPRLSAPGLSVQVPVQVQALLPVAASPVGLIAPSAAQVQGQEQGQAATVLPAAAEAARPALEGKAAWVQVFDGTAKPSLNGVIDARPGVQADSAGRAYEVYQDVHSFYTRLADIHDADRKGGTGVKEQKRRLWTDVARLDEKLNGAPAADFAAASTRLKAAHTAAASARKDLHAKMRATADAPVIQAASQEVRRSASELVGAQVRAARLLLEGVAPLNSKEARRNAALLTLQGARSTALRGYTETAFGEARTLRAGAPVEVRTHRWQNPDSALKAPAAKVLVPVTAVYPDRPTAVRAQDHQIASMEAEADVLGRRASEMSFWVELLQQPLAPAENAAFTTFLDDSLAWAERGAVPAKREAAQNLSEAASAAAQGSFAAAAARIDAARNALDSRLDEIERIRLAVERRAATMSVSGRQEALLEAAARWRRLLKRPLDAARAADLAGEARIHREAYLSDSEPGLPGYARAAKDLERLEAALVALSAPDARALVDRFEENLIHRRSLRISIVVRQAKEGGTTRASVRFALPGTTLKTMLKRIGGIPEKPEVRVNGGAWTPYSGLELRGTLKDETVLEILLP